MEKLTRAAERATRWLEQQIHDDGSYGLDAEDLACYYKSPYLFSLMGQRGSAHLVLDHIKERYFRSNGDFTTSEKEKSANPTFCEFWAYTNGWIAIAAQRMGRFDIAQPAYDYVKSFYHPKLGGFTTQKPYNTGNELVDVITTAHLGLTSLYFGDMERAKRCGALLADILDKQPDIASKFFLRVDGRGTLVTTFSHEAAGLHQVSTTEDNQYYFMIGYPIAFLGKLFQATGERKVLEAAKRYLQFAMSCRGNVTAFHFSHKVMWGAALLASITGNIEYATFASHIADHLISMQSEDGGWLVQEPFHVMIDQTAEIAIWLTETADELSRMRVTV